MHAEVGAAQRERDGERRRRAAAAGSTRVIAVATAKEEVAWAEGKLSELGAPPSGGSPSSTGRGRLTSSLTRVVEADRDRAERGADQPRSRRAGSSERQHDAEHEPDAPLLPALPSAIASPPRRGRVPAGAHRSAAVSGRRSAIGGAG